ITSLHICPVSIMFDDSLETLKRALFEQLEIIRIYTKKPGHKADLDHPFVLPEGGTITDVAEKIHTSFLSRFRFARVWGPSAEFEGQQVGLDHTLADTDVVELVVER
ncbi:MAG: TGS domain-containing protein, partial [Candidatus Heimdallarchaeota archaeon]|nr:TGS domain-containing protein [Candidatus Heimdallarchaeota archaeon]